MNKYCIDTHVDGIEDKQRYTAIEKARRVIALQDRIDVVKDQIRDDISEKVYDILEHAKSSNSTEVVKYAEKLMVSIEKLLNK